MFVIITVLYVFISPVFDLDPSANRAWRAALTLMASIALTAAALNLFHKPRFNFEPVVEAFGLRGSPDPLQLTCTCLC